MTRRPFNLRRVRASLQRIERVLVEHPELKKRTVRFLAGELPEAEEAEMGRIRGKGGEAMVQFFVRMPAAWLEEAAALLPRIAQALPGMEVTKSDVLRAALRRGLDILAVEMPGASVKAMSKSKTKK